MGRPLPQEIRPDVEQGVQLGMPGAWAADRLETSDHLTTKIGGQPDWPDLLQPLRSGLAMCSVCGGHLSLVAQVHAPLAVDGVHWYERTIYVLGCPARGCGSDPSCWRAIRVQREFVEAAETGDDPAREESSRSFTPATTTASAAVPATLSNENRAEASSVGSALSREVHTGDWWDDNTWSDNLDDGDPTGEARILDMQALEYSLLEAGRLAATFQESQRFAIPRIQGTSTSRRAGAASPYDDFPVLPCFYIYFQPELTTRESSNSSPADPVQSLLSVEEADDPGEMWGGEEYEPDHALFVDRTYLRFKKSLDRYPEQCIRYCFGGQILSAVEEYREVERCILCGGPRVFEMQLMPPLLYFLQQANKDLPPLAYGPDEWDWYTVIVFTCAQSCAQKESNQHALPEEKKDWTIVEEAAVIQQDFSRISEFSPLPSFV